MIAFAGFVLGAAVMFLLLKAESRCPLEAALHGKTKLYVSHGAMHSDCTIDWFIVEPRATPEAQVASLRKADRTVIELNVDPYRDDNGKLNAHGRQRKEAGLSVE